MEALAATSLAGTIVGLVDFGCKLTSNSYQVYRSAEGATVGDLELENVVRDLSRISRKLDEHLKDRERKGESLNEDQVAEQQLAKECLAVTDELEKTLKKVIKGGKTSKWRSFRQALLSVWHKDQIDGLEKRLGRFREQLIIRLLISLR
jgi:hypothetical protein